MAIVDLRYGLSCCGSLCSVFLHFYLFQPYRTVDRSNRQAQYEDDYHWYSKDMKTPDDNHSNAHHSQGTPSQVSSVSDLNFLLNSEVHCNDTEV